MRAFTPEISWHNRLPALSLDISQAIDDASSLYRVATGGNDCRVYIWLIDIGSSSDKQLTTPDIRIRAGLRRHQKSVGAVRFSSQHVLASGDDDGYIFLWKHKSDYEQDQQMEANSFLNDDGFEDLELWQQQKVLRGHIEDICDLAWSKDGAFLLSGSVDNSAILWDTVKGTKIWCSDLIKGYVQGVAIDPHTQFMAAISSDRALRIYNFNEKRQVNATRRMNIKGEYDGSFCDDTVQTFCRRFEFSPDGHFLITPTSLLIERDNQQTNKNQLQQPQSKQNTPQKSQPDDQQPEQQQQQQQQQQDEPEPTPCQPEVITIDDSLQALESQPSKVPIPERQPKASVIAPQQTIVPLTQKKPSKPQNVIFVFKRSSFKEPLHYYPTGREVALCVRFSPVVYQLREGNETNFWNIPYRLVFAVATSRSVLIYDSQHSTPIGYVSQIHLARLTDLAWSSDGRMLMISSYDGYSTILTFEKGEFGEVFEGPLLEPVTKPVVPKNVPVEPMVVEPVEVKPIEVKPKETILRFLVKRPGEINKC